MKLFNIYINQECYLVSGTPNSKHAHLSGTKHPDSICMYRATIKALDSSKNPCHFVGIPVDDLERVFVGLHVVIWTNQEEGGSLLSALGAGQAGVERRMRVLERSLKRAEVVGSPKKIKMRERDAPAFRPMRHAEL